MGQRYKRFYITGSLSMVGLFFLIAPFIQYYYNYSDVTCGEECWTTFCMKNGNRNLYFYNNEELPLTFSPEDKVHSVEFYKKDGRFKKGDHPGYRPIDFVTPYSKGVKYVFKIPIYSYTCYGMEVHKDEFSTVKWSFGELDPLLIGSDSLKEICIELVNETNSVDSFISDGKHPNGTTKTRRVTNQITEEICIDMQNTLEYNDRSIDYISERMNCKELDGCIVCDDCFDGNCDGKIQPGESYVMICNDTITSNDFERRNTKQILERLQ